jgi:type II restriction enzyme
MDLFLDFDLQMINHYKSNSQKARIISEKWVDKNAFCPNCGNKLTKFENNRPVADFFCDNCKEEFELKSKNAKKIGKKITDGRYTTMLKRIISENNPNFLILTYNKKEKIVINFFIIPNFYFLPQMIKKRKPLKNTARRKGWIGCTIDISNIPEYGKIFFVKNSIVMPKKSIMEKWHKTLFLKNNTKNKKGWIIDIMNCIEKINNDIFILEDLYKFEDQLKLKHPNNNFIKDKIRQQLQLLRDHGIIEFIGKGKYRKLNS